MNALLEDELDSFDIMEAHWSTGTILAIFFAASLIAAVFVGLGYSFGFGKTAMQASSAAVAKAEKTAARLDGTGRHSRIAIAQSQ